ncbi:glycosyltransferase family 2 protein [Candidatus Uabimicrobium amorphum]|uniref:Glycosyl transferase n=1 Tax=Uabimicrobium amorphum TaxID=2596890 RepID=A0A5S9F247_UABAM|nr:glycosyltransferase family 2 protein [Candidatus Uabimicrobium amorphum]BBM83287.1 glycosyl transferase [Candidatus Uabimicrobium amorphum]
MKNNKLPISAIILTYNEEKNIEACIQSVVSWVEEVFVVDSYSTDRTLEIAGKYTKNIAQNPFDNYSQQRNWAFSHLDIKTPWIMNLDADHRATPELQESIRNHFTADIPSEVNGFLVSRRTIFMGKWIRYGGHYPVYHAIVFRNGRGKCEERLYDQHFMVEGKTLKIRGDMIDIITDSIDKFITRHNRWATLEAEEQLSKINSQQIQAKITGNPIEKRRFLRKFYGKFPLFLRPLLYFGYRYFLRLGFLDGKPGLIFHFLQGFWYRFLIDAKMYEKNMDVREQ